MGKRGSTAAGAAVGTATKKAKTADTDISVVGNWVQTKIGDKELSNAEKIGLLKNDPAESLLRLMACSKQSLCVVNDQPVGNPKRKV
jgi:hypothetical protein